MPDWLQHVLTDALWTGGATWGAGAMTLLGLALTYRQARHARRAAESARAATVRTVRVLNRREHLVGLAEAGQLTARIKEYVLAGNAQAARLGLELLRGKIDNLEASAHRSRSTDREERQLDEIVRVLERHLDEMMISPIIDLDAGAVVHQLNDVRRVLSRRMERMKRSFPEDEDG